MKSACEICGIEHPTSENKYHRGPMRVLVTTFPKSGTNLIIQMLGNPEHIQISHNIMYMGIPIKTDSVDVAHNELSTKEMAAQIAGFEGVAFGHIPYNYSFEEAMNSRPTQLIQLIRDPRDCIVSHYAYVFGKPGVAMNYVFEDGTKLFDRDDPILDLIRLSPPRWERFLPWMERAHVVRYEDLRTDPRVEAKKIVDLLGIEEATRLRIGSEDAMVRKIMPTKSPTFRKGGIGDWKSYFQPHHIREYKKVMAETAEELGYGV